MSTEKQTFIIESNIEQANTYDFAQNYKFLIGSIVPRPIAIVSTLNHDGSFNIAPFSFFTAVSAHPMIVAFCPMIRSNTGLKKDTLVNIEREKEFVINIGSFELAQQINLCATELPYGHDEFKHAGLHSITGQVVKAPRLKEAKIQFECKLRDIISYGEHKGAGSLVTGEVVCVHINKDILHEGRIDSKKLDPIGRGAGNDWYRCQDTFELERLTAQIQK